MNYSFKDPTDIKEGAVITTGNFTQMYPNTEIMKDLTLIILGGNFTNVKKQDNWIIKGGNWTQIDRCSHLHPEFIDFGLPECETECKHLVDKDTIKVDGIVVETIYHYQDIVGSSDTFNSVEDTEQ